MQELENDKGTLARVLSPSNSGAAIAKVSESEASFRFAHNQEAMSNDKLSEGIRGFVKDTASLETYLKSKA